LPTKVLVRNDTNLINLSSRLGLKQLNHPWILTPGLAALSTLRVLTVRGIFDWLSEKCFLAHCWGLDIGHVACGICGWFCCICRGFVIASLKRNAICVSFGFAKKG